MEASTCRILISSYSNSPNRICSGIYSCINTFKIYCISNVEFSQRQMLYIFHVSMFVFNAALFSQPAVHRLDYSVVNQDQLLDYSDKLTRIPCFLSSTDWTIDLYWWNILITAEKCYQCNRDLMTIRTFQMWFSLGFEHWLIMPPAIVIDLGSIE